jgi:Concanavalin A-like lectin/glucanases superfamily
MRLKFTYPALLACFSFISASAQNTALSFNGTSATSVTTSSYIVPTSGNFTVEFWYTMPSLVSGNPSGFEEFVSQGQLGSAFYIGTDSTNGNFRAGDSWLGTGVAVPLNQWTHVALVNAGGTATLYINGVPLGTTSTYSIGAGGTFTTVGTQYGGLNEYATATMDQLKIWSVALTASQVKNEMYGADNPSAAGLIADYQMNDGTGTTMSNGTSTTGLNGTLNNSPSWVYSPVQGGNNALNFDGASTTVIAQPSTAFELSSGTVEAEINPTTWPSISGTPVNMEIAGYRNFSGAAYSFHASSVGVGFWNGTSFVQWDYNGFNATNGVPYTIPLGSWTQLSFVASGTTTTLYVNGTNVGYFSQSFGTATNLNFTIGVTENSLPAEWFDGSIDEVRVWNTQQTSTQINQYMGKTLTGNETGLAALYSFDQGNPGNTNTGILTAIDKTVNNNNATLANFALTGSTSNFVSSIVIPLPVNFSAFTATKSGTQALLQWQTAQEENSHDFNIQRSTDGVNYVSIGDVPAAGNSSTPTNYTFTDVAPANGMNYYRLKETDLNSYSMYSPIRTLVFSSGDAQQLIWYSIGGNNVEVDLQNGSNEFYTLTDINGQTLRKGQLSSGKLYLSGLAASMYIVTVNTFAGQLLTAKVLVP